MFFNEILLVLVTQGVQAGVRAAGCVFEAPVCEQHPQHPQVDPELQAGGSQQLQEAQAGCCHAGLAEGDQGQPGGLLEGLRHSTHTHAHAHTRHKTIILMREKSERHAREDTNSS